MSLPNRLRGLWSGLSSPSGVRAELRPKTDFSAFQASKNAFQSNVYRKVRSCRKKRFINGKAMHLIV